MPLPPVAREAVRPPVCRRSVLGAIGALLAGTALPLRAQEWPAHALRLIAPFAAGGGSDAVARMIGQKLAAQLGDPVTVDNRPGAGGSLGTGLVAHAAPDGYTLLLASTAEIAINPGLYSHLGYDTTRDLQPIALVTSMPVVLIASPQLPVRSVTELIALARARPGELNVASAGVGTISHLAGERFRTMNGLNWTHVPYKGPTAALTDLVGGQVQLMFAPPAAAIAVARNEHARLIAISGRTRNPSLPGTPTVAESGIGGYDVDSWYGLFAPAGTPPAIVERLAEETLRALRSDDAIDLLAAQGAVPAGLTGGPFATYVRAEADKWGQLVRSSGARVD